MEFKGKGWPLDDGGMDRICETLGVTDAEVWAVLTVETRGFGFLSDRRPAIIGHPSPEGTTERISRKTSMTPGLLRHTPSTRPFCRIWGCAVPRPR